MEERRRTRSEGPPNSAENNQLIQWDSLQDPVRIEREQAEVHRLARQTNRASNITENRAESSEIPQEQHNNELDYEQRTEHMPTSGEIPPKEQRLENFGSQSGEISPKEQRLENIGVQSGEISPKQQQKGLPEFLPPKVGEIPQQKVHQLHTDEPRQQGRV